MRQRKTPHTSNEFPLSRRPRRDAAPRSSSAASAAAGEADEWIYGQHAALAVIANSRRHLRQVVVTADRASLVTVALTTRTGTHSGTSPAPTLLDARAIAALLPEGAVHQGLAVQAAPLPSIHLDDLIAANPGAPACIIVLDQATDPRNVGAVFRAAAAFGASAIIVQDRHGPPVTGALAKAASGALEHVPLLRVVNIARALRTLQAGGFWCVGFAGDSATPIDAADLGGRLALVFGAEDTGLRRLVRESCDEIVRIPISGAVESLNLATAAAVALYEVDRRIRNAAVKNRC